MRKYKLFKAAKILVMVVVAGAVFGYAIMHLWNWLMPVIFGLKPVTFAQALGLFVLGKLLFGGFHRHSGGRGWKRHMEARWEQMTPEERERFRAGIRSRRGCWKRPSPESPQEQTAV